MGYTAYDKMRENNLANFGINGPFTPNRFTTSRFWEKKEDGRRMSAPTFKTVSDLEQHAVEFIRENCENLRFDKSAERMELKDYDGKSLKPHQIPYNFEMDIDRRCLEVAIHRFLESGMAKDAFDVYFCYLEMFIGSYGKTKKMIEMLSEFEANASSLLMKHRDHYSHSVYVFLIGLAFYNSSECFRKAYKNCYGRNLQREGLDEGNEHDLAAHFLKYWGLTSLFHDIGYPFELSFEQMKSYFGDTIDCVPFVTFNMNNFQNPKMDDLKEEACKLLEDCKIDSFVKKQETDPEKRKSERKDLVKKMEKIVSKMYDKGSEEFESFVRIPEESENIYADAVKILDAFVEDLDKKKQEGIKKLKALAPDDQRGEELDNLNAFLAHALYCELGEDYAYYDETKTKRFSVFEEHLKAKQNKYAFGYEDYLYEILCLKPEHPEAFGGYIDHAYFSSIMLLYNLMQVVEAESLNEMYTHAITGILLHNSLYKFSITNYKNEKFNAGKHFRLSKHPLAYLLMLCDELQCWDRTSYGQNSRGEVHPFDCELKFEGNRISATYVFDKERYADGDELKAEYKDVKGTYNKLQPRLEKDGVTKKNSEFLEDIEHIISLNHDESFGETNEIELEVCSAFERNSRYRSAYLSTSNFIHLYKFAILVHKMNHLNGEKLDKKKMAEMEKSLEEMSLEYKINHISRAKKFAKALKEIGCFYSDKPMDCEIVSAFDEEKELSGVMGPIEHERWIWEHWIMGWKYGDPKLFEEAGQRHPELKNNEIRECTKLHKDMVACIDGDAQGYEGYDKEAVKKHFEELDESHGHDADSKEKDLRSMRNLLQVLATEDGIKVYRLKELTENR